MNKKIKSVKSDEYVIIGTIGKLWGLKGIFNIRIYSDDWREMVGYENIYMKWDGEYKKYRIGEDIEFKMIGSKLRGKMEGFDVDRARSLVNETLYIKRCDLKDLEHGTYYYIDLIGCECYNKGSKIGDIKDVKNYGSCDLLIVKRVNKKDVYLPLKSEYIIHIDIQGKRIEFQDIEGLL